MILLNNTLKNSLFTNVSILPKKFIYFTKIKNSAIVNRLFSIFPRASYLSSILSSRQQKTANRRGTFVSNQHPAGNHIMRHLMTSPSTDLYCFREISHFETYEKLVYDPSHLLIILYTSECSTPSLILRKSFEDYAKNCIKNSPNGTNEIKHGRHMSHVYMHVDVDKCPRAAYHADIDDIPTVVLMMNDDAYRVTITPTNRCQYDTMMDQLVQAQNQFDEMPISRISKMTSRSAWFDHNIRLDNLNVHRLKWPLR